MIGTTLGYDGLGSLALFVNTDRTPDRVEWKEYVDALRERAAQHGKVRLVVVAGSVGPDALQRKQLTDAISAKQLRTAVVSDSMVARGIVTAFRWYGLELSAFKNDAIDDAYRYVNATAVELEWLRRTVAAIRAELAASRAASR